MGVSDTIKIEKLIIKETGHKTWSLLKGVMNLTNREMVVEKLKAKLDQWNAELDKLEARTRESRAEVKAHHEENMQELKRLRDNAKEKLKALQEESGGAWDELKKGAEDAWDRFSEAVDKARKEFDN